MNKDKYINKPQLLRNELCCRLPYGLKCLIDIDDTEFDEFHEKVVGFKGQAVGQLYLVDLNDKHVELYFEGHDTVSNELSDMSMEGLLEIWDCQPYLRPMSSMTEEEKHELYNIRPYFINSDDIVSGTQCNTFIQSSECQDWLNEHMFDYRGLIEMGIALEAPEGMYKF